LANASSPTRTAKETKITMIALSVSFEIGMRQQCERKFRLVDKTFRVADPHTLCSESARLQPFRRGLMLEAQAAHPVYLGGLERRGQIIPVFSSDGCKPLPTESLATAGWQPALPRISQPGRREGRSWYFRRLPGPMHHYGRLPARRRSYF